LDPTVNATGQVIEGFVWPDLSRYLFYVMLLVSNILLLWIMLTIGHKCVVLKMHRSAEHAFFCTFAQLLCMSESMLIQRVVVLHIVFGTIACLVGWMGIGLQVINRYNDQKTILRKRCNKHSTFGYIGSILLLISALSGFLLLFHSISRNSFIYSVNTHCISSVICYVAIAISQLFSYNTGLALRNWSASHIDRLKLLTLIAATIVCLDEVRLLVLEMVRVLPKSFFLQIKVYEREY
ncbi:hypothetical protein KR222_006438, partial [Zaprionus bogoriensis]